MIDRRPQLLQIWWVGTDMWTAGKTLKTHNNESVSLRTPQWISCPRKTASVYHLEPWPSNTPRLEENSGGRWPRGALEAPDPKSDGCERSRLTGARCSGSQSNWGADRFSTRRVRRSVFTAACVWFLNEVQALSRQQLCLGGTRTPKDTTGLLMMKNLFDKGQYKHPSAEWQRSGGTLTSHMAGINTMLCSRFWKVWSLIMHSRKTHSQGDTPLEKRTTVRGIKQ